VLILLPPSEGKASPAKGPKLALKRLSEPNLTGARAEVLDALITLCASQPARAAAVLGLGPKLRGEVEANARLRAAPTAAAIEVYTGVLYEALGAATLSAAAKKRLAVHVRIGSALFGLLTPEDQIPAYRLSGDVALPGIPALASIWREPVGSVLEAGPTVILDLRSGAYVKLAPPPERAFLGRILLERNGKRSVVSHHNKATKGRLVRGLVERGAMPKSDEALLKALHELGYTCEIHDAARAGQPATLDIIVTEV
jgi:cytoplasmic iron level regulating protein YaaA (DUF328/UPF0246 family)